MRVVRRLLSWTGRAVGVCAVSSALWVPTHASLAASSPEPSGSLGFSPASGDDWTPLAVVSTGTCSDPRSSNLQLMMSGHGLPGPTNVTPNLSASIYPVDPSTGGYDVPLQDSLHNFAAQQSPPAVLSGRYDFTLVCKKPWGRGTFGAYHGALFFSSPSQYRALTTAPTTSPTTTSPTIALPTHSASPVSPRPQVGHTTAAPKPSRTAPRSSSPAPVTSAAPAPGSPQVARSSLATRVPRATQPEPISSVATSVLTRSPNVVGASSAASASPSTAAADSSARQLAADQPRSRAGSATRAVAAGVGTLSVVVALGFVLRRRLGHRGPS